MTYHTIICTTGPLLSFPVINAKISVEQLSCTQGSSPAMVQNCAVECMAKVRLQPHTACPTYVTVLLQVLSCTDLILLEPVMAIEVSQQHCVPCSRLTYVEFCDP